MSDLKHDSGSLRICPVCGTAMQPYITSWTWRCPQCYLQSARHDGNGPLTGWESDSSDALTGLRADNARRLLDNLEKHGSLCGLRLLDVGCAAGWFLEAAREHGLHGVGIEPDKSMAELAQQGGHEVRNGWFPDAIETGEQFDLVSFNDVFEHLPDVDSALEAIAHCLPTGGRLLLNLPCARGFLYRLAAVLVRCGIHGPFERLWQCGYESPHLYYFDHDNLRRLVEAHGFRHVGSVQLDSLALTGLWARINENGRINPITAGLTWMAMVALYPALRYLLPNDIMVQIHERC